MMIALQWTLWIVGLGLQSLLLVALSHGIGRKYPALFAYVLCLLGTTAADIFAYAMFGKTSTSFVNYYWSAELVRQSALFALVVSLAFHAIPAGRKQLAYHRLFTVAAVAIWAGSFIVTHDQVLNKWMTAVVRNLSFFTGMLNLIAWFAYARSADRDMTRLMLVAGLGLQMTGEAIGQAVRLMRIWQNWNLIGGMVVVLSHLLCLFIWWRAFRTEDLDADGPRPEVGLENFESRSSLSR